VQHTTAIAFDFETYPIAPGRPFPPAVCMSYAIVVDYQIVQSGVVPWQDGIALLEHAILQGWDIVGANTAFDVFVAAYNSPDVKVAVQRWISVYAAARVVDVLLRQKLLDGAVDDFQRLKRHSLAAVVEHWTGVKLAKGADTWRLRYGELDGVPVADYPPEAYAYALHDAWYTAVVWICQELAERGQVCPANGVNYRRNFPSQPLLIDQHRQAMKALALADLAGAGLRTNGETVAKFKAQLLREKEELLKTLVPSGLVRREVSLNYDGIAARMRAIGIEPVLTASGKPSLTRKVYERIEASVARDASVLLCTQRVKDAPYSWPQSADWLADHHPDLVHVDYVKCEDRARLAVELVYLYLDDEEPKRAETATYDPRTRRTVITYGSVKVDADNCDRSKHPTLAAYARYSSVVKTLGSDIGILESASREPFHAHYTTLKDNGRTATGSDGGEGTAGNVQNMPRKPGVRECWEAPEGWLFCAVDFAAVELSTFGQVCLWWLGWSECARMIQAGVDQHSVMGAALLQLPDPKGEGAKTVKANKGDPRYSDARTGGKGMNFGCKAKMSAKRYKDYAWNNYQLKLTLEDAQRHINLHNEMIAEMAAYTQKVTSFARSPGKFGGKHDLVHPWSGRVRADLSYTDVHNYPFSGLAQDMAAVALWDLFKAKWGVSELGESDPFTGCSPCLFTHDEVIAYVPADPERGNAAARRQAEIMVRAARKVLPDVGSAAEPNLQKQLSKKAGDAVYAPLYGADGVEIPMKDNEALYKATGYIVPFDAWDACRADLTSKYRKPDLTDREWLTRQEWPGYVIDDVLRAKEQMV
jgi:hypothetical protein